MIKYEASLVVQTVKNLPAMQEIQVWSLGQEDPLLKGMANHSSILAWRIPWTKEPGGLQSMELQSVRHDWASCTHKYVEVKPQTNIIRMTLKICVKLILPHLLYSAVPTFCMWSLAFFFSYPN